MAAATRTAAAALLLAAGCAHRATPPAPKTAATAPAAAVARLAADWWERLLRWDPVNRATYLGVRRFDRLLPDRRPAARAAFLADARRLLARARGIDPRGLPEEDRVTLRVVVSSISLELAEEACHPDTWDLDQLSGPQVWLAELAGYHTIRTAADAMNLAARYRAVPVFYAVRRANLRRGLARGWAAPRIVVERVVRQIAGLLATPPERSPFASGLAGIEARLGAAAAAARAAVIGAIREAVYPALTRQRAFLEKEYLPRARATFGIGQVPGGLACYRARIYRYTGSRRSPQAIHEIGVRELRRLQEQMARIARRHGFTALRPFLAHVAGRPDQYLPDGEALLARAREIVARARAAMPRAFGRLPKTPLVVRPIEAFRAADAPIAYYYEAPDDGSRPAIYYLNTANPRARPLYDLVATTYHETLPGHHLQTAIAQETKGLPDLRRREGQTAFVEGWALYAEALADELGLYRDDFERFGYLNAQALRAVRLVVDTGIHALGWSRARAIAFMKRETAVPPDEVVNEIDRYIAWPGQALAYMLGRMGFERLRGQARARLGERFDLRAFHDEVLRHGAVPMDILEEIVARWIGR